MLSSWTLPVKATLTALICSTVAVLIQFFLLERVHSRLGIWLVLAVPFACCVFAAWLFTWSVTRRRFASWIETYARLARGEWDDAELPDPSPDAQSAAARKAFLSMVQALNQATAKLSHADAQRRRLFADLAHELGTPITSVLGIADALEQPDKFGAPDRTRLVAHLQHEAARLQHLAADVRALALLDDPDTRIDRRAIDLGELAASAAERAQVLAGDRIHIACLSRPAPCHADPQRIDQVLTNLLANATRYTPDGGRIEVEVGREGDAVRLSIGDSGTGVPDEMLPRLGERLLRLDPSRDRKTGGHGLGLAIVAAVVERHQGTLAFSRAPLGGLQVVVRLPTT
jgi:signal transduction histidine kinase